MLRSKSLFIQKGKREIGSAEYTIFIVFPIYKILPFYCMKAVMQHSPLSNED